MAGKLHTIELTPDLEAEISRRIRSGSYKSEADVIRAGLRALDRDEDATARRLAELDASIARGVADADAGHVHAADDVFADLRDRVKSKADKRGR